MESKNEACHVCNGTGSNESNFQNLDENEPIHYEPIECPNCGGSGIEPES